MCAKVDRVTKEVHLIFLSVQAVAVLIYQDIHRVATRIFRPHTRTTPMNGGLGACEPTVVAIGKNAGAMSEAKAVLAKWGLGSSA
jgi:hypothetical protein